MSVIGGQLADFAESMGLASPPGDPAILSVSVEGTGLLQMEERGDELVVSLAHKISLYDDRPAVLRLALASVHHERGLTEPTTAALRADHLIFLCRFREHEVDGPRLRTAVRQLVDLHERVRR